MKISTIIGLVLFLPTLFAEDSPLENYYNRLEKIEAQYRSEYANLLLKADRVVLFIVDFDESSHSKAEEDPFGGDPTPGAQGKILITPYKVFTPILKEKVLTEKERFQILPVLARQVAVEEHSGGAFCHFPIHGIRIFQEDTLLHEGTFCWVCGNFSFSYPRGSTWLDTTKELEQVFSNLLPVPKKELEKFEKKYRRKGKTEEKKTR